MTVVAPRTIKQVDPAVSRSAVSKLSRARAGLVLDAPFFGSIALRVGLKEDPSVETAWTDGVSLGYNPTWVDSLPLDELKGVVVHECLHVACAHHARRQGRDPQGWNIATDAAINGVIVDSGFKLPAGGIPGDPQRRNAEAIYPELPKGGGPGGDDYPNSQDPGGCGGVRDYPGNMQQAEQEAQILVAQAEAAAKACGNLPAALRRLIDEILEPVVPWKEALRKFVDQSSPDDYSWQRPNRRFLAGGLYMPGLYNPKMRPIVVAVDTSGSIGQEELRAFGAEINGIMKDTRTQITVIYCDAAVAGVEEYEPDDTINLRPMGGGGTDFVPVFQRVEEMDIDPSCLIYLTDLECNSFPEIPPYPVLWAVNNRWTKDNRTVPFGEVLRIDS